MAICGSCVGPAGCDGDEEDAICPLLLIYYLQQQKTLIPLSNHNNNELLHYQIYETLQILFNAAAASLLNS
jgi:hypothetical protein